MFYVSTTPKVGHMADSTHHADVGRVGGYDLARVLRASSLQWRLFAGVWPTRLRGVEGICYQQVSQGQVASIRGQARMGTLVCLFGQTCP